MRKCNKKRFTKFEAMLYLANSDLRYKKTKGRTKRKECRYYYCNVCKAYHLTSMSNTVYLNLKGGYKK